MKLGDILRQGRNQRACVPRPVTFTATIIDDQRKAQDVEVDAVLFALSEDDRELALVAARAAVRARHLDTPTGDIPPVVFHNEDAYQILARALHVAEPSASGARAVLFDGVDDLRAAVNSQTAQDLFSQYENYLAEEYLPTVDDEAYGRLIEDAAGKSLRALRSDYASKAPSARIQLLSSIVRFMKSPTPTSGAGAP